MCHTPVTLIKSTYLLTYLLTQITLRDYKQMASIMYLRVSHIASRQAYKGRRWICCKITVIISGPHLCTSWYHYLIGTKALQSACCVQRAIVDLEKRRVPHLKMLQRKIIVLNCISVQGFIIDPLPDRPSHVMIRFVTIKVRTVGIGQAMIKLISKVIRFSSGFGVA